jgi:hypothetical protein
MAAPTIRTVAESAARSRGGNRWRTPDVREVVDVGEYPYRKVDGGDDEQVSHGRDLRRTVPFDVKTMSR